jgi:hypothetical protein
MSQNPGDVNPMDPFGAWRTMRDTYMDAWSKMMIDMVNSEAYAEASGRLLDTYLSMSTPFRQAIETAMTQVLTQFNMPTRSDVTSLAERLTNIEFRLDDLDARLDALSKGDGSKGKKG